MSTGESKRPSLMTGTAGKQAEQSAPPRILADMEGLPAARPERNARRLLRPMLLFCLLACVCVLGWALLAPSHSVTSSADAVPASEASSSAMDTAAGTRATPDADTGARDTAVIVDDTTADDGSQALASIGSPAVAGNPTAANTSPAAAGGSGNLGIKRDTPPAGIASRAASRQGPASRKTASRSSEPDLLATLMANIGGTREPASKSSSGPSKAAMAGESSAMDELVANIRDNRDENYTASATALGTIASGSGDDGATTATRQFARSADVQSELRSCPKANTLRGIECRKRVCSKYAGQDAACPQ